MMNEKPISQYKILSDIANMIDGMHNVKIKIDMPLLHATLRTDDKGRLTTEFRTKE